jgi:hypothetical protein
MKLFKFKVNYVEILQDNVISEVEIIVTTEDKVKAKHILETLLKAEYEIYSIKEIGKLNE